MSLGRGRRRRESKSGGPDPQEGYTGRTLAWLRVRRAVFRFVLLFALLVSAFYLLAVLPAYRRFILDPYLTINAAGAATLLRGLGEEVSSRGLSVGGPRFLMEVGAGCDGIEPSALFAAAVLAFPATLRRKLLGLSAGIPPLLAANFARILSLYYAGAHSEKAFDLVHLSLWPPLFVLLVGGLWAVWALRTPEAAPTGDADR